MEEPSGCQVDGGRALLPLTEAAYTPYPWYSTPKVDFSLSPWIPMATVKILSAKS